MATEIYKTEVVRLIDGTEIEILPLKIKYFKQFMDIFKDIDKKNENEVLDLLLECTRICMKQHYPIISKSISDIEDSLDIKTMNTILYISAGVKIGTDADPQEESVQETNKEKGETWEELDLAKIETEVFLVGKWKNFEELEESISMPELVSILNSKRELEYEEKKFLAGIQGIDIDNNSNKGQKEWEDMKARVFSGGTATDSNDILALQGENARKAGFGIGLGLEYENLTN